MYLLERRRELTSKYNSKICERREANKKLTLLLGATTVVVLRILNATFELNAQWYVILVLMNIIFSFEFNLVNDPYDKSFIKLLKVDEYIKDQS